VEKQQKRNIAQSNAAIRRKRKRAKKLGKKGDRPKNKKSHRKSYGGI
jgi:hypothetical protein